MKCKKVAAVLLSGLVITTAVGCHFSRMTDPNPKPLLSGGFDKSQPQLKSQDSIGTKTPLQTVRFAAE